MKPKKVDKHREIVYTINIIVRGRVVESVDTTDLKSVAHKKAWGFKSPLDHDFRISKREHLT